MLSKSLKVLIVGLALAISSSSFAQSQESPAKQQNPDRTVFLKKELNLNTIQIQSFNSFYTEYTNVLKSIRTDATIPRSDKSGKYASAKEEYYRNLKSFLTEEQFSKYLATYDGSLKSTVQKRKVD